MEKKVVPENVWRKPPTKLKRSLSYFTMVRSWLLLVCFVVSIVLNYAFTSLAGRIGRRNSHVHLTMQKRASSSSGRNVLTTTLVALGLWSSFVPFTQPVLADPTADTTLDRGGNSLENTKIRKGGASTLQQGIVKTITRGVNLDGINLEGQNLKGVAFQQSIVRFANFKNANLFSASFFDATCDNSDFEGADMTQANIELAQFKGSFS